MAVNVVLDKEKETSRVAILDENNNNYVLETLPANETLFSHKANLFVSKGKTGKVLEVHLKNRIGSESFIEIMQKALARHYNKDFIVGLGGVFLVTKGNVKQHLIPSSLEQPSHPDKDCYSFNMSAPLIAVGSFISAKTSDFSFREENNNCNVSSDSDYSNSAESGYDVPRENKKFKPDKIKWSNKLQKINPEHSKEPAGPLHDLEPGSLNEDLFSLFLDEQFYELISAATNKYSQ
ncbi:ester hydrolase C11orf54 homolog [Belonocnema kinseyi]|uniref:ester hydrolase C11orf54 homolog n=1 Tax=Belonocnema kinseyi TaxID=2817044 RepID=UPI00143D5018|nr:ester hydrolase C11orf54 homolog [Belonocnema kinseyi]